MTLCVMARAKINLTIDILGKRPDGFHEVEMIMQSIELADRLCFSSHSSLRLDSNNHSVPLDERNDIIRAARLLQRVTGTDYGAEIFLEKNIPVAAGLAGGSCNGAAALWALNELWELGLDNHYLIRLASQLGSDMPFCLQGGTQLATGRGEQLQPLPPLPRLHIVLMKPSFGVSTQEIYRNLDLERLPEPATRAMQSAIERSDIDKIIVALQNALEAVTMGLHPILQHKKTEALSLGALSCLMSGSGPTLFAVAKDATHAADLASKLASPDWWICTTTTSGNGITVA